MKCPSCHNEDTPRVADSRPERQGMSIRRRRICDHCGFRFSTSERVLMGNLDVIKRDGTRERFDIDKLIGAMMVACGKRPISKGQIQDVAHDIQERYSGSDTVTSEQLGEDVMAALRDIDHVAYIRFASVYRNFADVSEFENEMHELVRKDDSVQS